MYTDSLISLLLINKAIYQPHHCRENKHLDLLNTIARRIVDRLDAGAITRLYKVRSHSGIDGNEQADQIAREAALKPGLASIDKTGEVAHRGSYWPVAQPCMQADGTTPPPRMVANLTKDIKANLPRPVHIGKAPMKGVYSELWERQTPTLLPVNHRFWNSATIPWWQKIQLHKARWGRLWNKKLAYRWKMPYAQDPHPPPDDTCPICHSHRDGASHILAECPAFKGAYINRHNEAVRKIYEAISKGDKGGLVVCMDAGPEAALPQGLSSRPPMWLKPQHIPDSKWNKLRPDILLADPDTKNVYI